MDSDSAWVHGRSPSIRVRSFSESCPLGVQASGRTVHRYSVCRLASNQRDRLPNVPEYADRARRSLHSCGWLDRDVLESGYFKVSKSSFWRLCDAELAVL